MRRLALGALAACAVAVAAPAPASADEPPFIDWNPLLPSVGQPYRPSRERDCVDGSPRCIEVTLGEMYRRFDRLYATCDHNAAFGITYIRVTEAIRRAINRGFYEEPRFLAHEDKVFARMYFVSYDAWERGKRARVPKAWRAAFDAARARRVNGLGNLLMSMNAHINRDMPFMLDALGLTMPNGRSRKPDHDRGNRVLNTLYDDVLEELANRFDPVVDDYNAGGSTGDDAAIFQMLQGWREQVWRHAEMLGAAKSKSERRLVANYIEDYALNLAREIERDTAIRSSKARDAHCAAYRKRHRERGGLARVAPRRTPLRARRGLHVRNLVRVRVRVSCPGPIRDCRGTLHLTRRGRRLSRTARVSVPAGDTRVVRLGLTRRGRLALARSRWIRMGIRAVAISPSPWGTHRQATRRLELKAPQRR